MTVRDSLFISATAHSLPPIQSWRFNASWKIRFAQKGVPLEIISSATDLTPEEITALGQ